VLVGARVFESVAEANDDDDEWEEEKRGTAIVRERVFISSSRRYERPRMD
jgi:hypothetical protein